MVLVYFNILTQSIAITDSMFNLATFSQKKAKTFDLTKIERKKLYFASMKFCCPSNAAIKYFKIARKKSTFFKLKKKIVIFRKNTVF